MDTYEAKIYTALLIGALIVGVIILYFFITIIRYHRKHIQLYREKVQAEIATLEAERKRVASDLHDDISPVLSTIKLQMNCLSLEDAEDLDILDHNNRLIDGVLTRVRETSNNLMPAVLVRKGLVFAIKEIANAISQTQKLSIEVTSPDFIETISPEQELHVFRIIQEAINNCIKHSDATLAAVKLTVTRNTLDILVKDNGKGFDYRDLLVNGSGRGLKNIINRIDLLEGEVFVDAAEGKGVSYSIVIPIKKQANG